MTDAAEARRNALRRFLEEEGGFAKVVEKYSLTQSQGSYLSQLTAADSTASFGEKSAKNWEERLKLPPGALVQAVAITSSSVADVRLMGDVQTMKLVDASAPVEGYVRLPQLDLRVGAGEGLELSDRGEEIVCWLDVGEEWAARQFGGKLAHIRVMTAKGDSMTGAGILNGDLLFVDTSIRHYDGDGFYVFAFRNGQQVKRLRANVLKQRLEIVSLPSPAESIQIVEPEDEERLHIAGRVSAWWTLRK